MSRKLIRVVVTAAVVIQLLGMRAHADLAYVAERNRPAVGFPAGFTYFDVDVATASIGPTGTIAFSGRVVDPLDPANSIANVIWRGRPGSLTVALQENDPISGLPPSIVFQETRTPSGYLIVNANGDIAQPAILKGAVANRPAALLVTATDQTFLVWREGDPAPGFPGSVYSSSAPPRFSFSNGGLWFQDSVSPGPGGAIFHWDYNDVVPVLSGGDPIPSLPGCSVAFFSPFDFYPTDDGSVIVNVQLDPGSASGCALPSGGGAVLRVSRDNIEVLARTGQPVPGMAQTEFIVSPAMTGLRASRDGEVTFSALLRNTSTGAQVDSNWAVSRASGLGLLAVVGETISVDPPTTIGFGSLLTPSIGSGPFVALDAFSFSTGRTVLAGPPRANQPYPGIPVTGTSHLVVVAAENYPVPGYAPTTFWSELAPAATGDNGLTVFNGAISDAIDNSIGFQAIWRAPFEEDPQIAVQEGMPVEIDGLPETLESFETFNFKEGSFNRVSDTGDILFEGSSIPFQDRLGLYLAEAEETLDADGDGVADAQDNCLLASNPDQRDSNFDGFGNLCDADFNDDCIVNVIDLGSMRSAFFGSDPDIDLNGDGSVNVIDLGLLRALFFAPPGPSGVTSSCD